MQVLYLANLDDFVVCPWHCLIEMILCLLVVCLRWLQLHTEWGPFISCLHRNPPRGQVFLVERPLLSEIFVKIYYILTCLHIILMIKWEWPTKCWKAIVLNLQNQGLKLGTMLLSKRRFVPNWNFLYLCNELYCNIIGAIRCSKIQWNLGIIKTQGIVKKMSCILRCDCHHHCTPIWLSWRLQHLHLVLGTGQAD